MSIEEHDLIAIPGEEYITKHEYNGPAIMKKHESSWLPFSRTHLEEIKHHASKFPDLGKKWKYIGYLSTMRPLISDVMMLPVTAFYKLKDKLT